jgi:lipopolysaccharide export system protein LptA
MIRLSFLFMRLFFCAYLMVASAFAVAPPQALTVVITGDEMQYTTDQARADVIGNAHAQRTLQAPQGNRTEDLSAKRFQVFFKPSDDKTTTQGNTNVEFIKAFDNVTFTSGSQRLCATRCDYNVPAEMITCFGNVRIEDKGNIVRGDEGEINLKTQQYKVRSSNKAVRALIEPRKQGAAP